MGIFKKKASCEDMGLSLAVACMRNLDELVQQMVEDADVDAQQMKKFRLESSALVFSFHKISLLVHGPKDSSQLSRIRGAFDSKIVESLTESQIQAFDQRGSSYHKLVRQYLGSENFGATIANHFEQFCLGREGREEHPIVIGGDIMTGYARKMVAVSAVKAILEQTRNTFEKYRLV